MTVLSTCESCGAPHPDLTEPCARCGWAPRRVRDPETPSPWSDEDETAERVETALAGEYEIEGLIGRGGMATVFLAREVALDRAVAIKVLAPHLLRSPGMAERFKREARLAAALSHRNIIPIHAVREQGALICIIMKRLTGRSLDQILRAHGAMPITVAQLVLHEVAAGLEFAHQRGVVHRDVKPANILIDADGEVVVTDFGIAKAREADVLTASGSTIGTPAYMSPEQAMGKRATPASDQYSLGAVAYELLAGRMPFIAETAMGLMYQHTHTPPEPLRSIRPDVPVEVAEAVDRMLAKNPEARFPSLPEATRALGIPPSIGAMDDPVRRDLARRVTPLPPVRRRSAGGGTSRFSRSDPRTGDPTSDPEAPTLVMARPWPRRAALGAVLLVAAAVVATTWGLRTSATRSAARDTTQVPVSAPPAPAPAAVASKADSPPAPRPQAAVPAPVTVRAAIETYRRAVESRDVARIIAAFPAVGTDQVERYREFFRQSSAVRFLIVIKEIKIEGEEARVDIEGALQYHDIPANEDKIVDYRTRARLANGPAGWRILEIR